jgi:hypothetical protein
MKSNVKQIILIIFFVAHSPLGFCQQQWKMQAVELQSRWAKNVDPQHTHEAYPRPQLKRKNWTNLNGLWNYAITRKDGKAPTEYDGKILVPYPIECALSGVKKQLLPNQNLWYNRYFEKPKLKNNRLLLNFGAVDWQATVFINGKKAGNHTGGYTSFSLDITDLLVEGQNELSVKVYDPSDQGIGPHGKQVLNPQNIYYTASSGIWQTVWLETVPENYITGINTTPDIDKDALIVKVFANQPENKTVEISASIGDQIISTIKGNINEPLQLSIPNAHLWSPEDPFLYNLHIRLNDHNVQQDAIDSYFGMRKVSLGKDEKGITRILLNNKFTYNLGVLDQGFWPAGLYTAPNDEALEYDIKAIKTMGFNTIRKHIKIEPARWYYLADSLGMLVWQDFVNPNQGLPPGAKEAFEQQVTETMDELHNFPCITTWVLFNERWGAYDQQRLTKFVKNYDPSRLVDGHSGELLYVHENLRTPAQRPYISSDVTDVHSYPNPINSLPIAGKARVLGEFGGIGVSVPYHEWNDLRGWGYVQLEPKEMWELYAAMTKRLKQLKAQGLSASIYTQPFDVEGEENGLVTYDREIIKIPLDTIREINRTITGTPMNLTKSKNFILAKDIDINDTDQRYKEYLADFESGRRDSTFMRRLILMAGRQKDQNNLTRLSDSYLRILKNPLNKQNLIFLKFITNSSKDNAFMLFMKNAKKINDILGRQQAEGKIISIITREQIKPFTTNQYKTPDWDAIQESVKGKYGDIGERIVLSNRIIYYWDNADWQNMGTYYKEYYKKYLSVSDLNINNVTWAIFQHVSDQSTLRFAAKVAKVNFIKYDTTPEAADTYANILYKIGKTKEAIIWQEKAAKMSNYGKSYVEALDKMRAGIPTWQ